MNTYDIDTLVTLTTTFTLSDGVTPVDPDTVTLYIRDPDGLIIEPSATRISAGNYSADVLLSKAGAWIYKFRGTGTVEITSPDVNMLVLRTVMPI